MATLSDEAPGSAGAGMAHRIDGRLHPSGHWVFSALLVGGLLYAGFSILLDAGRG